MSMLKFDKTCDFLTDFMDLKTKNLDWAKKKSKF